MLQLILSQDVFPHVCHDQLAVWLHVYNPFWEHAKDVQGGRVGTTLSLKYHAVDTFDIYDV